MPFMYQLSTDYFRSMLVLIEIETAPTVLCNRRVVLPCFAARLQLLFPKKRVFSLSIILFIPHASKSKCKKVNERNNSFLLHWDNKITSESSFKVKSIVKFCFGLKYTVLMILLGLYFQHQVKLLYNREQYK